MRDSAAFGLPDGAPMQATSGRPDGATRRAPQGRDQPLAVEVVFATRGRATILANTVDALAHQTLRPLAVTISCGSSADLGRLADQRHLKVLIGEPGLARQRNLALQNLSPKADIVVFFDDDFVAHPRWIEEVERCFRENPDVVGITGHVVADGIKGPGLAFSTAVRMLTRSDLRPRFLIREARSPYGCNMAFRCSALGPLAFDERLVLYGWLEDRDFGGALARRGGRLVQLGSAMGVHLGAKAGRVSGRRLGYSQIVNPCYLYTKGTMSLASLGQHWFKNVVSNLARSLRPEPFIDRRGRLSGNILGAMDLLRGIVRPERAETV